MHRLESVILGDRWREQGLTVTPAEADALRMMIAACKHPR